MKKRSLAAASLLVLGLAIAPAIPAQAATLGCGSTITASTTLTTNLVCSTDVGITVKNGATLDLGGHTITGPGTSTANRIGIYLNHATVKNGTVTGWESGLSGEASGNAITSVTITKNRIGINADFNGLGAKITSSKFISNGTGFQAPAGTFGFYSSTFTDNTGSISYGFDGVHGKLVIDGSTFTGGVETIALSEAAYTITNSTISGASDQGIHAESSSGTITNTTISGNKVGVNVGSVYPSSDSYTTLTNLTVKNNATGIAAGDSLNIVGGTFTGNNYSIMQDEQDATSVRIFGKITATVNGATLTANGSALVLKGYSAVGSVKAYNNSRYGIYAPLATDLGKNVAYGNGKQPQCTGVVCAAQ